MILNNSPKRKKNHAYIVNGIYNYYAGFSDFFVKDQLETYVKNQNAVVLDPWNGSGTTTLVSTVLGIKNYGFDINPVMVIIAKAKLYNKDSLRIKDIENLAKTKRVQVEGDSSDPLNLWFLPDSVKKIRMLERIIFDDFFESKKVKYISELEDISSLTPKQCFLYVCFFKLMKAVTKDFVGTNPTWVKSKIREEQKKDITYSALLDLLISIIEEAPYLSTDMERNTSIISLGDSTNLLLANDSVDLVLTSPPYCTRIDYAVYTIVELALLGISGKRFIQLRKSMIGTPTITENGILDDEVILPNKCIDILNNISIHSSKAASTYYYKTYCQYFISMLRSAKELYRVLGKDCKAIIVVQDSWFKDIHIDMSSIMEELFLSSGFALEKSNMVHVKNTMSYLNPKMSIKNKQKKYIESILDFRKV